MKINLENIDLSIVNALRRIILTEIPNVAIVDNMNFSKNNTPLHNEFMSHRISLIPCLFDQNEIDNFNPDLYKFVLDVTNNTKDIVDVTTKDIKIFDENNHEYPEKYVRKIFPPCKITKDYILITRLKQNESIDVTFRAAKGIGKTHSKWCTVSKCTHFLQPDENEIEQIRKNIPADKLNQFDTIDKWRIYHKDDYGEPNKFVLDIESECRLTPEQIFKSALNILIEKLQNVTRKMQILSDSTQSDMHIIQIPNENHTIGNVLQAMVTNKYIRNNKTVEYCGYYEPHPLEANIIVKIKFSKQIQNVKDFFETMIKEELSTIKKISYS